MMVRIQPLQSLPADATKVITSLRERLSHLLQDQMVGLYLCGSIVYGCFNPHTSDVDFTCVIKQPLTSVQRLRIRQLFDELRGQGRYGNALEGTFPVQGRMNECESALVADRVRHGEFDPDSRYEKWPLERHELHEMGLRLSGPEPQRLFAPSQWPAIQRAMVSELLDMVSLVRARPTPLQRLQAVLNACRVLYGLRHRRLASKLVGLEWAFHTFPEAWQDLLERAHSIYTGLASLTPNSFNPEHVWAFCSWAVNTLPQDMYARRRS